MKLDLLQKTSIQILLIIFIGLLIYSNTFNAPFVFDDAYFIVSNPAIKDFSYFKEPSKVLSLTGIPTGHRTTFITRIAGQFTFALNYHQHRLDVIGYHLFNILVHIANGLLVYFFIRVIFQTPYFTNLKPGSKPFEPLTQNLFAFLSALIFICHPIQTQAVTYISQRFASLAALFYLLSLFAYIKSRLTATGHEKYILYGLSLLSAIMAMLVKELSFTLPVVILLSEYMFFSENFRKKAFLLFPFSLTMLVIPTTLLMAKGFSFSINNIDLLMKSVTSTSAEAVTKWDYLFTQFRVLVTYIRLLLFPINQNLDYDYPIYHSFFAAPVIISFIFLLLLFCLGVYFHYRSENSKIEKRYNLKLISFGILWFFITLSVESSIVVLLNVIFEHRLYLPSVGFIICVMAAISMVVNETKSRSAARGVIACIAVVILVFAGTAYARNSVWRNNVVLWQDVVSKSPQKARPHLNLGVAYDKKGLREEAIKEYLIARKINPDYVEAHNKLGFIYMTKGWTEDAINEYLLTTKINPDNFEAHNNLGILYAQKELFDEALREFQAASAIAPNNVSVRKNIETVNRLKE
ncbi:tetratricopeptide repeat protein [Thermodesulfobacteriota bacterium]